MRADPTDHDPLTNRIIQCAIDVHTELGPGLLESPYCVALVIALLAAGMHVEKEKTFPILYRGTKVGDYRPDLIVERQVVVEIKSVARYDPVFLAQMLTYLRVTGHKIGLILNFNRPRLVDAIKRVSL
jgi:GxxExxY protein